MSIIFTTKHRPCCGQRNKSVIGNQSGSLLQAIVKRRGHIENSPIDWTRSIKSGRNYTLPRKWNINNGISAMAGNQNFEISKTALRKFQYTVSNESDLLLPA